MKLSLCLCLISALTACGTTKPTEKNKQEVNVEKLSYKATDVSKVPQVHEIDQRSLDELLGGSYSLPLLQGYEGYQFVPCRISNEGKLFGYAEKMDKTGVIYMMYIDVNRQNSDGLAYKVVKELTRKSEPSKDSQIIVNYVDTQYMLFTYPTDRSVTLYDIEKNLCTDIDISKSGGNLPYAKTIKDGKIYFTSNFSEYSTVLCYDIATSNMSSLTKETSYDPFITADNLYYIQENKDKTSSLISRNLSTEKEIEIFKKPLKEGTLSTLSADNQYVYFTYCMKRTEVLYRYDIAAKQAIPFIRNDDGFAFPALYSSYLSWYKTGSDSQPNGYYNIVDLKNKISYTYGEGPVYMCERGIVWVKYTVDQTSISKGTMFAPNNSQLYFVPFK